MMAITKETTIDKIEIATEHKIVQVRKLVNILENGQSLSKSYERYTIVPGQDYQNEQQEVREICSLVHTTDIIEAYNEYINNPI